VLLRFFFRGQIATSICLSGERPLPLPRLLFATPEKRILMATFPLNYLLASWLTFSRLLLSRLTVPLPPLLSVPPRPPLGRCLLFRLGRANNPSFPVVQPVFAVVFSHPPFPLEQGENSSPLRPPKWSPLYSRALFPPERRVEWRCHRCMSEETLFRST